ncbi:MAG: lipoyl(octanoyl) transferase LipB [Candidatus Omnitrophota bacterium]
MNLEVIDLGRITFKEAFLKQIQTHNQILSRQSCHTLILCEHPHTLTLPRQAKITNILDVNAIKDQDVDFIVGINRGGEVTYHGPGQLMGYLVFDLRELGRDLGLFLNKIEEAIIKTLGKLKIKSNAKEGYRGVWVGDQKIASIGIGIDKWVSLHGFALNIATDLNQFDRIRPCGLDIKMTSIKAQLNARIDINVVKNQIIEQILEVFGLVRVKELAYA